MDTVVSRCQLVRFDPLPPARIAQALEAEGVEPTRALACARMALGNGERARLLASDEGQGLLDDAEAMVRVALGAGEGDPSVDLLAHAKQRQRPGGGRGRSRPQGAARGRTEGTRAHRARAPVRRHGQA